ncbi:MAG TPA: DUF2255 family protein [Candidatus Binatia bacterium]|nr:DUF2255 family protein [Candidatus Binatia bacterium]
MRRALAALAVPLSVVVAVAALAPDVARALEDAKYVYVQSERKSGALGKPAEIWFFSEGDAVYVGTRPSSWRVRRIKAGRRRARVAVGKPDGPAFDATAEIVHDPKIEAKLLEAYAKKYPDGWSRFEKEFREGFESGDRVLVRYTPAG